MEVATLKYVPQKALDSPRLPSLDNLSLCIGALDSSLKRTFEVQIGEYEPIDQVKDVNLFVIARKQQKSRREGFPQRVFMLAVPITFNSPNARHLIEAMFLQHGRFSAIANSF